MIGADRPPRPGGDTVTVEGERCIAVVYSEYDLADAFRKSKKEQTGRSR